MAILLNAHFDAATSGSITTANELGISATIGTTPTFSGTDALHGAAAMLSASAVSSLVRQNFPTPLGLAYWRGYVRRVGTNASSAGFASARDSTSATCANLAVSAAGNILLRDGLSAVATSSFVLSVGSWVRCEWTVDRAGTTQSLGLYYGANIEGTTPDETLSGACTNATSPIYNITSGLTGASTGAQFAIDELAIGDAPIGPYSLPTITVTVWDGAAEVPATVTVWDGSSEVAASVDSIAT